MKRFEVGARVHEPTYGLGSVIAVEDAFTRIQFDDNNVRKFLTSLAKIEPSSEPAPVTRSRARKRKTTKTKATKTKATKTQRPPRPPQRPRPPKATKTAAKATKTAAKATKTAAKATKTAAKKTAKAKTAKKTADA